MKPLSEEALDLADAARWHVNKSREYATEAREHADAARWFASNARWYTDEARKEGWHGTFV